MLMQGWRLGWGAGQEKNEEGYGAQWLLRTEGSWQNVTPVNELFLQVRKIML